MAKGQEIVLDIEPKGTYLEGIISGTPKPGTLMEQTTAAAANGRFTYQAASRAAGVKGPVFVLLADPYQGKLAVGAANAWGGNAPGDAYVSGTRGFLYAPVAGDELNMLVADIAGTADDIAIGDKLGTNGSGLLKKDTGSYASTPFQANEALVDPTGDSVIWCTYLGNQA